MNPRCGFPLNPKQQPNHKWVSWKLGRRALLKLDLLEISTGLAGLFEVQAG